MYHPNEVRPDEKDLNNRNIAKISKLETKSNFNFVLLGDTQRFYEDLEDFVNHINATDSVAFVLLCGDLVDFGLNKEFNWIASKLNKLNVPYVSVIGNHDMVANGRRIFHEMFGPDNFVFSYGANKFICINSNSREFDYNGSVPDINWLSQQLNSDAGFNNIFVLSHVPPFNVDFDKNLEPAFTVLLAAQPKTRVSLHGHEHHFSLTHPYPGGLPYLVAAAAEKRSYVMISVNGEKISMNEKFY
jgi:predicted phosphodiesterase